MNRLFSILKVRPDEQHLSVLLIGLMFFTSAGSAVGGNATEALFFARFGVALLPAMYIILGLFTFFTSLAITALMGRIAKHRLYVTIPFLLGLFLIGERLVIFFNFKWFFALMWLSMNVINSLQGLLTWGLAGTLCDTRQAKRLFPLFSAGGILGTVLGGLLTQPLAAWLHSENLLFLWAAALFASYFLGRVLIGATPAVQAPSHEPTAGIVDEMQRGYQFVRRSPIMQWVSYSAILFSICYFSLALPFSRGATAQFPNADQLAGFLGLFQGLNTGAALLAALFLTNRMFTRFGILPMLLVFPMIYLTGFSVLAVFASAAPTAFALLVVFRFIQMGYMNGLANTSWQALFNVVPPEQRDQVRAFIGGVPEQAGTFIAGLLLLVGEQALQPQQLYLVGLVAAMLLVYVIWRASRAYGQALVQALRTGQPQVFLNEEQSFDGARIDASAFAVVIRGLTDPDASVRRVSAEIISHFQAPEAITALVNELADGDPTVRVVALKGLAQSRATSALLEISASLSDPEPEVRSQAISTLGTLAAFPRGMVMLVEPLLSDGDPFVRAQAALALLMVMNHNQARNMLHTMLTDANPFVRAQALTNLGTCGDELAFERAASALEDIYPIVRIAASRVLVMVNPQFALNHLIHHLNDDDSSVRRALGESIGRIGESALEPLVETLAIPSYKDGALLALEYLPAYKMAEKIRMHAKKDSQIALHYHSLAAGIRNELKHVSSGNEKYRLLLESLDDKAHRSGLNALRALGLIKARDTVSVAVENLRSSDPIQRANALETLEAVGERDIIQPLITLWESGGGLSDSLPESWLLDLLDDPYSWIRACAVLVAAQIQEASGQNPLLADKLKIMSCADPDEIVRAAAENALLRGERMETLTTLSLMERILFLKRVPLFADLPPADLKQVASVTSEVLFSDGQALARQGEPGKEMYIIVSGEVQVLIAAEGENEPREVAVRRSGDCVAELAVISQESRMASLIAHGAVRTLCLKQKQFEGILRERPEISLALLRSLTQRLKEASGLAAGS